MTNGASKAALFKAKGAEILKPHNMQDLINNPQTTQLHKTTNAQNHIPGVPDSEEAPVQKPSQEQEKLGRLHIQIRQDLIDRLLDMVFKRKRAPGATKRTASQRAIVEEALEQFLKANRDENG